MKKLALVAAVALMATTAMAGVDVSVGDIVKVPKGGYDLGLLAGPITLTNTANGHQFSTFCVEMGATIYVPDISYRVSGLGYKTVDTGYEMSERTAWLYTQYRRGTLGGYANASAENDALQYAIWRSMGYGHSAIATRHDASAANSARDLARAKGWWEDDVLEYDVANWTGYGNVRVANLVRASNGQQGQDQLAIVPVPAAAMLGMFGLSLAGWAKRRLS